jgi:flagellar motility protein MotE (MotC chaperone)
MQNTLVKTMAVPAAVIVVFTLTFVALFMFSKKTFVQILARPSAPVRVPTPKEVIEHRQFVYWNFHTTEINKMILDLSTQRADLQKREDAVAADEARIVSERKENERIRDEIIRTRKELSEYIVEFKSDEASHLREQVSILSNMSPENIVAVFNEKSDQEVVKILALMKPDMVAQILEAMMAQTPEANKPTPQKRAATLLDMLKRLRQTETAK